MGVVRQGRLSADARSLFWVVIEDHQARVFDVFGPLDSDVQWTNRVTFARERGRDVTICTVTSELDMRMMSRNLAAHGYARNQFAIL